MTRPLRVTFILPALTEATSPYWRPIEYSLFPPLGLATLAAYLSPDDEAAIVDRTCEHVEHLEHVERLDTQELPRSRGDSGLHHECPPRLPARRRVGGPRERRLRCAWGPSRDGASRRGRPSRRHDLPGPGRADLPALSPRSPRRPPAACVPVHHRPDAGHAAAGPPRSHQPPPLSRPELHRRHPRLPATLRLLLQGRLLRRRPFVLHPARRRRAR